MADRPGIYQEGWVKTLKCLLIAGLVVLYMTAPAHAVMSDSMRCGNGLVSIGAFIAEVLKKCGEPTVTAHREDKIIEKDHHGGVTSVMTVAIDDWTYNFGPDAFMYNVIFENGRVVRIESLDYGY